MDNSALYGLRNPAFTDDIGMTMINRQFPSNIDSITGCSFNADLENLKINPGQPGEDTYNNKPNKKKSGWKNFLLGSAIATGLAAVGYALFKKVPAVKTAVMNIISKIKK